MFPKVRKSAVIAGSILCRTEKMVFFVVVDGAPNVQDAELDGLECAFGTDHNRVKTPLHVYANALQYYHTSSIWACSLPDGVEFDMVSVLAPSSIETIHGTGVFHIESPDSYEQNDTSPSIVLCNKDIFRLYNSNNRTVEDMKTFLNHYHRLGVDHIIMYASEQTIGTSMNDLVSVIQEVSLPDSTKVTIYQLPSSFDDIIGVKKQTFTTNHCLYKSREAAWVLMQFDFDEILVGKGVQDLRSYLSSKPPSVDGIHALHYLPKEDYFNHERAIQVSSKSMQSWGKTLFRPKSVNVTWVHAPTNPKVSMF
jgi:hypothetical protein